jgi:FKBP-type peptidyl-prolyl cis-trans isomerase
MSLVKFNHSKILFHPIQSFIYVILLYIFPCSALSQSLSPSDENALRHFIHAIMWGSEAGYVLYGNKPVFFEGYVTGYQDITGKIMHKLSTSVQKGAKIWKKLHLPCETSDFLLIFREEQNKSDEPYSEILLINKKAFKQTFDDYKTLFRYVLGAEISSDVILNTIKSGKQSFYSVLKNDKVLVGLLLGFGIENALYVSRSEQLLENICSKKNETFLEPLSFFKPYKKKITLPLKITGMQPDLGYNSLEEEMQFLENKISDSSERLNLYSPRLIFGHACTDTSELIHEYEETQLRILQILNSEMWFEKVLERFFGENVVLFVDSNLKEPEFNPYKMELSRVVAQAIFNELDYLFSTTLKEDFPNVIKGMRQAEIDMDAHYQVIQSSDSAFREGFKIWSFYKFNQGLFSLQSVIDELVQLNYKDKEINENYKNQLYYLLHELHWSFFRNQETYEKNLANSHFKTLNLASDSIKTYKENRLYYQQILAGTGDKIDKKRLVNISYTLRTIYGKIVDRYDEGVWIDLQRTIKGFQESLSHLRVGERGRLFIHPEWGFQEYLLSPHFSYLIVEFKINNAANS